MPPEPNNPPRQKPASLKRPAMPGRASTPHAKRRSTALRRTIIPLLLTLTVLLPALGVWFIRLDEDSIFRAWPPWVPMALFFGGVVAGALAAFNMATLRRSGRH